MKLLAPINYLKIKHDEKIRYDFYIPLFLSVIITIAYHFLHFPLTGSTGLVPQINGLLQVLVGFYIAALAAVATFGNPSIDNVMDGNPPIIKESFRGEDMDVFLTRRRFLSYLFGYLALVTLCLFCIGLIVILSGKTVMPLIGTGIYLEITKHVFVLCYSFILMNIVTTTLLGLYYLSIRIHQG